MSTRRFCAYQALGLKRRPRPTQRQVSIAIKKNHPDKKPRMTTEESASFMRAKELLEDQETREIYDTGTLEICKNGWLAVNKGAIDLGETVTEADGKVFNKSGVAEEILTKATLRKRRQNTQKLQNVEVESKRLNISNTDTDKNNDKGIKGKDISKSKGRQIIAKKQIPLNRNSQIENIETKRCKLPVKLQEKKISEWNKKIALSEAASKTIINDAKITAVRMLEEARTEASGILREAREDKIMSNDLLTQAMLITVETRLRETKNLEEATRLSELNQIVEVETAVQRKEMKIIKNAKRKTVARSKMYEREKQEATNESIELEEKRRQLKNETEMAGTANKKARRQNEVLLWLHRNPNELP